ncbi:hypothetical protein INT45_012322 [Circinella minor]|uniref:F-box domain-containing protein n=1 Tax=Circinella minor TaxID=1195481 RepID=A0A8H7S6M3_9FUNG|nr:hypothetical protein INT45_012322 [Circinella minor]
MQVMIDPRVRLERIANRLFLKTTNKDTDDNDIKKVIENFDSLPVELHCKIMDQLSLRECVLASNVNRNWHELALRRPNLWRSVTFDDNQNNNNRMTHNLDYLDTYCQRQYIKNTFVRDIKIRKVVDENVYEIFDFIMKHNWNEIEQVKIRTTRLNASLETFLGTVSNTLTTLDLKFKILGSADTSSLSQQQITSLLPDSLLRQCPKLVTLIYSTTLDQDIWDNGYKCLDTPHQHLMDLAINLRNRSWKGYQLESLLRWLPKLRRFSLRPDKDENPEPIFTAITQFCPNLDCLNIISSMNDSRIRGPLVLDNTIVTNMNIVPTVIAKSTTLPSLEEKDNINYNNTFIKSSAAAQLRELVIDDQLNRWYEYAKALSNNDNSYSSNLIKNYSNTLECLDITGYWFLGPLMIENNLGRYSFPSLNMLYLSDTQGQPQHRRISSSLCTFLRHTPALCYADFTGVNAVNSQVMRALKKYNVYLETLRLKSCRNLNSTGLSDFFTYNVSLVEVRLNTTNGLADHVFGMLGDKQMVPSLRILEIVACCNVSLAGLDMLLTNLEKDDNDGNEKIQQQRQEEEERDKITKKKKERLEKFVIEYNKSERRLNLDWAIELMLRRLDKNAIEWTFIRPSVHRTKYERITNYEWEEQEKKQLKMIQEVMDDFKKLTIS